MASKSIYTIDPEEYSEHGSYVTAGSFEQAERKKPMVVQALELESRLGFQNPTISNGRAAALPTLL